jgi:type VI secretion system protein ImpA
MASPTVLDFAKLLAAIPGENPAGADLRADTSPGSAYHAVRDARSANRAAERQLLADAEAAAADWRPVLQRGTEVLVEKAKDLEVAAYVIEALVRLHGFAGLRDGLRLARELVEKFWDRLYPLPDEDGLDTRLAPLTGLNGRDGEGTLVRPILCVPLTRGENAPPLACYHVQQALALAQVKDEETRAKRLQEGAVPMETVTLAVAETSREFFAGLAGDLAECQDEFGKLCQTLEARCGANAPPTSAIRAALAACREALEQVARDKLPRPDEPAAAAPAAPANGKAAAAPSGPAVVQAGWAQPQVCAGAMQTRAEAFRLLLEVADYFRRVEPQSVVSYGLEQVVRWGKLSLPELLRELITDDNPRQQFFRQVGIRAAAEAAVGPAGGPAAEGGEDRRNKWVSKK